MSAAIRMNTGRTYTGRIEHRSIDLFNQYILSKHTMKRSFMMFMEINICLIWLFVYITTNITSPLDDRSFTTVFLITAVCTDKVSIDKLFF